MFIGRLVEFFAYLLPKHKEVTIMGKKCVQQNADKK